MDPAFVFTSSFTSASVYKPALIQKSSVTSRYARLPSSRATRATLEAPIDADQGAALTTWTPAETMSKSATTWPAVMSIESVMKVLPHRYPFLLLDRVVAYEPGKRAIAIKNVSVNEPFFNGHFPDRPIMPGVLQVEALAQVCGIVMLQPPISDGKGDFFFGGVDNVRWRKPVVPGDTLVMEVELKSYKKRFGIAKMAGRAFVDGKLAVEGDFTLVMVVEK